MLVGREQPITVGGQRAARNERAKRTGGRVPIRSGRSRALDDPQARRAAGMPGAPVLSPRAAGNVRPRIRGVRPARRGRPADRDGADRRQVDVGLLFTSDPAIATNGFVLLEDDKQLQLADNIVPVVRQEVLDANPGVTDLLNTVMERLTQEELTNLNKAVTVDARPAAEVATEWITAQNFDASSAGLEGDIIVGSTNFEQEILGEIFAQMLESNGATVERKFQLGNREIVFPALEAGEIDVLAEYAATALEFVNEGAGQATTDPWRPPWRCARRSSPRVSLR